MNAASILLAAIMKSDGVVKLEEMEAGRRILKGQSQEPGVWAEAIANSDQIEAAIAELSQAPLVRREQVIRDLWRMANSDGEIHPEERRLIFKIALAIGVNHQMSRLAA